MNVSARPEERISTPDPAGLWMAFLASLASKRAMSALGLDGYLTGVIVAPSVIRPGLWMAGLWEDDEPIFDDVVQLQSSLAAIGVMFNTLSVRIDASRQRLEAERICDYRPAFQPAEGKPAHDAIRVWARGFQRAMELAPEDWITLAEDARLEPILTPLVGFIDVGEEFEPAEDINDRLDWAAANIARAILLLRKIAKLRDRRAAAPESTRYRKLGRNEPCPRGSGRKYKRCCTQS